MGRSSWIALLLLAVVTLCGFDTRNPFRTRGPFKAYDFTVGANGSCIDGSNCYCDTVSDANLLFCEDFEDLDFYLNTSLDWAQSASGTPGDRGLGSQWTTQYGVGGANTVWTTGNPASPKVGSTCSPSGQVCGNKEYCSGSQSLLVLGSAGSDCWDGNSGSAIDIQRDEDYKAEIGSLTLTGGRSGGGDVFDGKAHFAHRVEAGKINNILGSKRFTAVTEVGVTMAVAYSSNLGSISLYDDPWKHEEWGNYPFAEFWMLGNLRTPADASAPSVNSVFPFLTFFWMRNASSSYNSACETALAAATKSVGYFDCYAEKLYMSARTTEYTQSVNWPFGTWGCVQAHIRGMGTTSMGVTISLNGTTLIQMDGFNATTNLHNQNYSEMFWNAYANANQGLGETASTGTGFRYHDNIHVRNGPPVSCAAIGF